MKIATEFETKILLFVEGLNKIMENYIGVYNNINEQEPNKSH